ncbi:MAG TPA: 4-(cytidine 5'-diphospho)-2-C-methyl-D-erythritol kinase [Acidimicrobiia bacterium]|nr:4-(cytidine 5'-diphospho)-2-C-methyl-D-erythritol kinase [Acidimicrobiia bacterium]
MSVYEAPAKVNLSLHVEPPHADGYHPIQSLVQTIEWCDLLVVEEAEEDDLRVVGAELDPEDNLVQRALDAARLLKPVPKLSIDLRKRIPIGTGLGGGSSDAAATLLAALSFGAVTDDEMTESALSVGADVPLFLVGGTILMSGYGEIIESQPGLVGLAVAVAVPDFSLSTAEVYRRWDQMEGPVGEVASHGLLPPPLRDGMPIRNDLTPAALDLEPMLGDFMADLRSAWGSAVLMTGSGSGCFGLFPDKSEADDAAESVRVRARVVLAADLRSRGVSRVES